MFWVGCVIRNPIGGGRMGFGAGPARGHGEFEILPSLEDRTTAHIAKQLHGLSD